MLGLLPFKLLALLGLAASYSKCCYCSGAALFDNSSSPTMMDVSTSGWRLRLSKLDGSIRSISSRSGGTGESIDEVTLFASTGPAWLLKTTTNGGRSIANSAVGFSYTWSATASALLLRWAPPPELPGPRAAQQPPPPHPSPPPAPPVPCAAVPTAQKKDCGFSGSTKAECLARGCCWVPLDPDPHHYPVCFNVTMAPPPPPPPPPPKSLPTIELTIQAANSRWFDAVLEVLAPPADTMTHTPAVYTELEWPVNHK